MHGGFGVVITQLWRIKMKINLNMKCEPGDLLGFIETYRDL